jgi:hypothetical protein
MASCTGFGIESGEEEIRFSKELGRLEKQGDIVKDP